jgi:hypothetical protein
MGEKWDRRTKREQGGKGHKRARAGRKKEHYREHIQLTRAANNSSPCAVGTEKKCEMCGKDI